MARVAAMIWANLSSSSSAAAADAADACGPSGAKDQGHVQFLSSFLLVSASLSCLCVPLSPIQPMTDDCRTGGWTRSA